MPGVLLIEDDNELAHLVRMYLEDAGFQVAVAASGEEGVPMAQHLVPDLVILDLMLPGMDGFEVCQRMRQFSRLPVLMLTARSDEEDRLRGFELGADDYVTKPFLPRELVARVRAVLRRTTQEAPGRDELRFPGLVIDRARFVVIAEGTEINLTPKEFDLLWLLASNPGRAFTRDHLLSRVWGHDYAGDTHTVDVHVGRLRDKLAPALGSRKWVKTVWGVGYKFEVEA